MLGPRAAPCLHTKGKETHGLLNFGVLLLRRYAPGMQGDLQRKAQNLLGAAEAAEQFDTLLYSTPRDGVPNREAMLQVMQRFAHLFGKCSALRPKFHLMFHLILQMDFVGHPSNNATYADESLNGKLARIARSTHRRRFAVSTLTKYKLLCEIRESALC